MPKTQVLCSPDPSKRVQSAQFRPIPASRGECDDYRRYRPKRK